MVEFEKAARGDAKLPFAHYYLGVIARKKQNLERARKEFLADASIEPDVAFDYEELGDLYVAQGADRQAEDSYKKALKLEPRTVTVHYALAKLYRKGGRLTEALSEANEAAAEDSQSASVHYLRAQVLQGLHRNAEAKNEFARSAELRQKVRDDLEQKISGRAMRDPL
jgi:tetratricopeptide (TPR) repeat protein